MTSVNLSNQYVSSLQSNTDRKFLLCTALDLSNNLLYKWTDLFSILDLFPSLVSLNIS